MQKANPLTNLLTWCVLGIIVASALLFVNWKPANVIVEYEESFKVGEQLSGSLKITLEPQDIIEAETPLIISLSKGKNEIETATLTLEEFVKLSDNPLEPVEENGKRVYKGASSHNLEVSKVINYQFTESGDYELFFNIFKLDLTVKKSITVD